MKTLKQELLERAERALIVRFRTLKGIKAPHVVLLDIIQKIRDRRNGITGVTGVEQWENIEVEKYEVRTGRGGKIHSKVTLVTGEVIGIFNGPYSRFAKVWKDKEYTSKPL